ncbi:OPT/YSL family transporter [bacterium]|nr:OPT/YSL family transporter [bacterium]
MDQDTQPGASAERHVLTSEEQELRYYKEHYRGDMPQLTLRAAIMGLALGAIMSLTNLYIGLKTGWGFGVAITACVLSWAIWKFFRKIGVTKSDMTILENNAMQSAASSAGYSTGGTLVSAVAAFVLVNSAHIGYFHLTLWIFFLALLGVTMAIPMKRQMINVERLRFPSGIAAAATLRSLHHDLDHKPALQKPVADIVTTEDEDREAAAEAEAADAEGAITDESQAQKSANALFFAGGLGALLTLLRDGPSMLMEVGIVKKAFTIIEGVYPIFGKKAMDYTVAGEGSLLLVAAGGLMGFRVAASIMLGAILNWVILVPMMYNQGVIESLEYRTMVSWSLWGGAACMVTSGLLAFAMQWKSVVRALSGVGSIIGIKSKGSGNKELDDYIKQIEVPGSWMVAGGVVGALGIIYVAQVAFGMPIWMSALAIFLSFFLALVACRTTGETDTSPIGAMGKVMQLVYGGIAPGRQTVNLMAAGITAGVADSSSALLIDLKSGYVLGAQPRKQFLAQFWGIFIGTAVTVPTFYLLVPDASALGTDQWPAPAAVVWAAVAELLANGMESIHPTAQMALWIGGLVGILLVVLQKVLPPKARIWVPSPLGLGLAFTFHFWYALSMFIGGLIQLVLSKSKPKVDSVYTVPTASGLIAGESLMGIFLILIPLIWGIFAG